MDLTQNIQFGLLYLLTGIAMVVIDIATDIGFCLLEASGVCLVGFTTLGLIGVVIGSGLLAREYF
ncbi:uncharacterized protein NP_5142A [Natronomonas pharaonis DSM 2160]|uniref:Uncharacterized protein n=1 Tax=Natronomonas pharaonis (strain ATCC 35678 / DSM 2160 / CIP 103997 / JCM 8858 / NBRC 14720 / NCIMB 2260 / Gabara) TaxID=348780 RepID=A0A1U7EZE7_NATPD|nr:hypothetical protein [Natronomonas pharaonis]CAI50662.1 uncharacterized protein NP_5142A [Natronomonas pharaonis DSM 2160]